MVLKAGKGRHTQIEPPISFLVTPQHQFKKQVIHDSVGSLRKVPHEVDGQLLLSSSR